MTGSFSLPRHLVTILRHMERYKELLMWSISDAACGTPHKIALTLTWNFKHWPRRATPHARSGDASRLDGSVRRAASDADARGGAIPAALVELIRQLPARHKHTPLRRRLSVALGNIRRGLRASRTPAAQRYAYSSFLTPRPAAAQSMTSLRRLADGVDSRAPRHRSQSLPGYTAHTQERHAAHQHNNDTMTSESGSRFSLAVNTAVPMCQSSMPAAGVTSGRVSAPSPSTHTSASLPELEPHSSVAPSAQARRPSRQSAAPRVLLHYRSESSLDDSLEELMQRHRVETLATLQRLQRDWHTPPARHCQPSSDVTAPCRHQRHSSSHSVSEHVDPATSACAASRSDLLARHDTAV